MDLRRPVVVSIARHLGEFGNRAPVRILVDAGACLDGTSLSVLQAPVHPTVLERERSVPSSRLLWRRVSLL